MEEVFTMVRIKAKGDQRLVVLRTGFCWLELICFLIDPSSIYIHYNRSDSNFQQ